MADTIRKQFIADDITKDAAGDRVRRFVISTGSVDRDNDTISAAGWQLDNYRKNPVVQWAHDYKSLPIARALHVGVENDKLVATAEFADHPMAETVLRMIDGGFLRATSVGFRPIKRAMNEERGGYDFQSQELLEFSVVPVPANPEALIEARDAGIDVSLVQSWAEGVMKALSPEPAAVAPIQVEHTFRLQLDQPVKAAPVLAAAADDGGLELADEPDGFDLADDDPLAFEIDPALVREALRASIRASLEQIAVDTVRTTIAHARGRVD